MVISKSAFRDVLKVVALFDFFPQNNDEGSYITIVQAPSLKQIGTDKYEYDHNEWWEGNLNGVVGWFPCNHVEILPGNIYANDLSTNLATCETIYKNCLNQESDILNKLHELLRKYLRPLYNAHILTLQEYQCLLSNLEHIAIFHDKFFEFAKDICNQNIDDRLIGSFFLKVYNQLSTLLKTYCKNHPKALKIISNTKTDIELFLQTIEKDKSLTYIWQMFCSALSLPFRHTENYRNTLWELRRLLPENHKDCGNIQRALELYGNLIKDLQELRKQSELEQDILSGPIEGLNQEEFQNMGTEIAFILKITIRSRFLPPSLDSVELITFLEKLTDNLYSTTTSQIYQNATELSKKDENITNCNSEQVMLVGFPDIILMLSCNAMLNGFVFKGKIPMAFLSVESYNVKDKSFLIISSPLIESIVGECESNQDAQKFMAHFNVNIENSPKKELGHDILAKKTDICSDEGVCLRKDNRPTVTTHKLSPNIQSINQSHNVKLSPPPISLARRKNLSLFRSAHAKISPSNKNDVIMIDSKTHAFKAPTFTQNSSSLVLDHSFLTENLKSNTKNNNSHLLGNAYDSLYTSNSSPGSSIYAASSIADFTQEANDSTEQTNGMIEKGHTEPLYTAAHIENVSNSNTQQQTINPITTINNIDNGSNKYNQVLSEDETTQKHALISYLAEFIPESLCLPLPPMGPTFLGHQNQSNDTSNSDKNYENGYSCIIEAILNHEHTDIDLEGEINGNGDFNTVYSSLKQNIEDIGHQSRQNMSETSELKALVLSLSQRIAQMENRMMNIESCT